MRLVIANIISVLIATMLCVDYSCASTSIMYSGTFYDSNLVKNSGLQSELGGFNQNKFCKADGNFDARHINKLLRKYDNTNGWNILSESSNPTQIINLAIIISKATDFERKIMDYNRYDFMVGVTMVIYSVTQNEKIDLYYTRFELSQRFEYKKNSKLTFEQRKECIISCLDAAIENIFEKSAHEYNPSEGVSSKRIADSGATFQVDKFIISKNSEFQSEYEDDCKKQFIQWVHDSISQTREVNLLPPFSLLGEIELNLLVESILTNPKASSLFDATRTSGHIDHAKIVKNLLVTAEPEFHIRGIVSKCVISTIKEIDDRRANLYSACLLGGVLSSGNADEILLKVKCDDYHQGNRFNREEGEDIQFMFEAIHKTAMKLGNELAKAIAASPDKFSLQ